LKHYDNDSERLVNALFDNVVPEHLRVDAVQQVSTGPIWSTPKPVDSPFPLATLSLLEQRANEYDDDPFNVFNQDNIDRGRIFRGKKSADRCR
jgi:hypothetical protein